MFIMAVLGHGQEVMAETYYVAPQGAPSAVMPDGSLAKPFTSIGQALYSGKVKGGDTVLLMDGSHGSVSLYKIAFDKPVIIASQNGKNAHIDWISIKGASSNMSFERITVWPTDRASMPTGNLIETLSEASDIVFSDMSIRSSSDAVNYLQWDAATWDANRVHGFSLNGPRNIARGNQLTAIYMGITLTGTGSMALDNVIDGFNGDGLRPLGDNNVVRGNLVKNCAKTDANHDDGIQGFKANRGTISGLIIDRNTILEWTAAPDHPLRCSLQGMFLSDAIYENLMVTNNLVATSQYHGITLSGGKNAKIINNTVVNAKSVTGPYPWLKIWDTPLPVNVLVANNVAMSVGGPSNAGSELTFRNNSVIGTPGAVFENSFAFDYRPKASSGFVDTGDGASAPSVDILGKPRPAGNGPDRGAYEVTEAGATIEPPALEVSPAPEDNAEPTTEVPTETEPVVTDPVVTDPVVTDPVVTDPVVTDPVVTDPVKGDPMVTEPVVADPVVKKPLTSKGKGKPVGRLVIDSMGSMMKRVLSRMVDISF